MNCAADQLMSTSGSTSRRGSLRGEHGRRLSAASGTSSSSLSQSLKTAEYAGSLSTAAGCIDDSLFLPYLDPPDLDRTGLPVSDEVSHLPTSPLIEALKGTKYESGSDTGFAHLLGRFSDRKFAYDPLDLAARPVLSPMTLPNANHLPSYHDDAFYLSAPSIHNEIIEIGRSRLTVKYVGKSRNSGEIGAVRTNRPWANVRRFYYFEARLDTLPSRHQVYIGLSEATYVWNKPPGHYAHSYGLRSDDGKRVGDRSTPEPFSVAFSSGAVVGCGFDALARQIFFTLNGKYLGVAFTKVRGRFHPTVSLNQPGETISVNLGTEPFLFDLAAFEESETLRTCIDVRALISQESELNNAVALYLCYHGYAGTLEALGPSFVSAALDHDESWQALHRSVAARCVIREAILRGDASQAQGLAVELLSPASGLSGKRRIKASPPSLSAPLLMLLKCQQWIELLRTRPPPEDAIRFMQDELARVSSARLSQGERDFLERCLALVAYSDPLSSPHHALFEQTQRERTADLVNQCLVDLLLSSRPCRASPTPLEATIQQLGLVAGLLCCQARERHAASSKVPGPGGAEPSGSKPGSDASPTDMGACSNLDLIAPLLLSL